MIAPFELLADKTFGPLIRSAVAFVAILAMVAGTYLIGHHLGAAEVRTQWDTAKAIEAAREDTVAKTVSSLSAQLAEGIKSKLAELDTQQTEAIRAAKEADVAPVDARCNDVRRGIPSSVVRELGKIR